MSSIWTFIVSHQAVLIGLGVALLDFLFAVSPSLSANGILHQVYLWLKGSTPVDPQQPTPPKA